MPDQDKSPLGSGLCKVTKLEYIIDTIYTFQAILSSAAILHFYHFLFITYS
jgi:hypothetical protein